MTNTANMNPKNLMLLALLGIGAYMLTMRKASAGTLAGGAPAIAKSPPTVYGQSPTAAIQPPSGGNTRVVDSALNALGSFFSGGKSPLYRAPGYTPGYFPDSTGEAAARDYVVNNPDAFASNPPTSYIQDPQYYVSTGGYLDSQ